MRSMKLTKVRYCCEHGVLDKDCEVSVRGTLQGYRTGTKQQEKDALSHICYV
jgi:hypothetical protein